MIKTKKKGFTIVELVIVIAVIAILAAVLIPTFSALIRKANVSNDTTLVRNLNTALAADAKEHKTMQSALDAAAEGGFDIGKINAKTSENIILWDGENDVFCYLNDGIVEYVPNSVPEEKKLPIKRIIISFGEFTEAAKRFPNSRRSQFILTERIIPKTKIKDLSFRSDWTSVCRRLKN